MGSENLKEMDILLKELCDNIVEESDECNKENDENSQVETKSDLEGESCVNDNENICHENKEDQASEEKVSPESNVVEKSQEVVKDQKEYKSESDPDNPDSDSDGQIQEKQNKDDVSKKWYEKALTCRYCYKVFKNYRSRNYHQETVHTKTKQFECPKCNKAYTNPISLQYHITKACLKEAFKCKNCKMTFESYKQYMKHRRLESKREELSETINCEECKKPISRKNMRRHSRDVHGDADKNTDLVTEFCKPFKCDQCNKYFNRKDNLNVHKTSVHSSTTKQRITCNHCDKTFSHSIYLNSHIAIKHSHVQPIFKCKQCDKYFNKKGNLNRHINSKHNT